MARMIWVEVMGGCCSTGSGYIASGGTESTVGGGGKNDSAMMRLFSWLVDDSSRVPSGPGEVRVGIRVLPPLHGSDEMYQLAVQRSLPSMSLSQSTQCCFFVDMISSAYWRRAAVSSSWHAWRGRPRI